MEEQGTDFMGNGLLWKTDRGLVEMDTKGYSSETSFI